MGRHSPGLRTCDQVGGCQRGPAPHQRLGACKTIPHYEVDNALHGVGAIQSRGTVRQYVDPLDSRQWNVLDIGEFSLAAAGGNALAVDEYERGPCPAPMQVDSGALAGIRVRFRAEEVGVLARSAAECLRQRSQEVRRGRGAARIDLLPVQGNEVIANRLLTADVGSRDGQAQQREEARSSRRGGTRVHS